MLDRISSVATRYVIVQTLRPLGATIAIGLLLLLSERMIRLLEITLGKKNSFSIVFEMLAYLVPHYLGLALPAAFFLGLLFSFNQLSKASEIDAFMASGVGLHQLTRPVLAMALVFTMIGLLIFGFVQPHARYAYRALVHAATSVEIFYLAEEGVFMQAGTRTFILDELSRRENRFERIFLFEDRGEDGSRTVSAANGSLVDLEGETRPVLRLENGHRLDLDTWPNIDAGEPLPQHQVGEFSQIDTPLGQTARALFRSRGKDERELTLPELIEYYDAPPGGTTLQEMKSELQRRLVSIATILILPILAIPFALGRRRGQRAYRFAVAMIILVVYNEVVEQGALAVRVQDASIWFALWLPFFILTSFALWRYYRVCFTLRPDTLDPVFDRLSEVSNWVRRQFLQLLARRA